MMSRRLATSGVPCDPLDMTEPLRIEVKTDDGVAPCFVHDVDPTTKKPGVVLFPDAGNVRPVFHELASTLAREGYVVFVPNVFYRAGDYPPFDLPSVFGDPKERERLMKIMSQLDNASAVRDAKCYVRALREQPGVQDGKIGVFGYCLGGRLSFLSAGAMPEDVGAALSFHGGHLVTDKPDSPHLAIDRIQARLYFGIADNDGSCPPEHIATLFAALATHHVQFTADFFKARRHGFAVKDFTGIYDPEAHATHVARLVEILKTLQGR